MTNELTTQQRAAQGSTVKGGVSGRLKAALDDMMWNGTDWDAAAVKAGLRVRSMRLALKRPQVLAYMRRERGVLLASMSPKNLQRLGALRDQDDNKAAAVQAARVLENLTSEVLPGGGGHGRPNAGYLIDLSEPQSAGVVIQIINGVPERTPGTMIDITPEERGSSE